MVLLEKKKKKIIVGRIEPGFLALQSRHLANCTIPTWLMMDGEWGAQLSCRGFLQAVYTDTLHPAYLIFTQTGFNVHKAQHMAKKKKKK